MPTEKNIKTPEALYGHFSAYKIECKENPKFENIYSSKTDKIVSVPREIPYTWDGFEIYLRKEKILAKLDDYKANKDDRYSQYADIIRVMGVEIRSDKMDGAYTNIYQHNIVARDLGLADKQTIDQKTKEIPATIEDIDDELIKLFQKAAKNTKK